MTSELQVVHHPGYSIPLPASHPFPMAKFRVLREHLDGPGYAGRLRCHRPEPVDRRSLERVHAPDYVAAFLDGRTSQREQKRTGFRWSEALRERTLLEVGGTLLTVRLALARGLACNTAGGTHHAHPDFGAGYCLLNDMAVAAAAALDEGLAERILIVDLDVHQGDGTAVIFDREPRIFTLSMHGMGNFPATKQRSDLDIPLPEGCGDEEYLAELADNLPGVLAQFRPDLVIYDAGVDVHEMDRLGRLRLTDAGVAARDHYVLSACRSRGIPVAAVIGGGYDRDLEALADRHEQLFRAAAAVLDGATVPDRPRTACAVLE